MKKKIFAIAMMLICISIIATTTLAYFTDVGTSRNVITTGGIRLELVEQQLVEGALVDYPAEPIPVMPGQSVSKIVSVKGMEQEAWIRMRFEVTLYNALGEPMELTAEELARLVIIQPDGTNWIYSEGWWYCDLPVAAGVSTPALFDTVTFASNMGNEYQRSTVYVDVTAQAVQKANNGATALDAVGWPED